VIADRLAHAAGARLHPREENPAGKAVHYGIGILPAALYAVARERLPYVDAGRGSLYGLAMFLFEDELANPVFGFSAPPGRYPWQAHARGLVAHLVYGVVTDAVLRALDGRSARRDHRDLDGEGRRR